MSYLASVITGFFPAIIVRLLAAGAAYVFSAAIAAVIVQMFCYNLTTAVFYMIHIYFVVPQSAALVFSWFFSLQMAG